MQHKLLAAVEHFRSGPKDADAGDALANAVALIAAQLADRTVVHGKQAVREVGARLLRQGLSLTTWARKYGYCRVTVYRALYGLHKGKRSDAILAQLASELGVAL